MQCLRACSRKLPRRTSQPLPWIGRYQKAGEDSIKQAPAFLGASSGRHNDFNHPRAKAGPRQSLLLVRPFLPLQIQVIAMQALVVDGSRHEAEFTEKREFSHEPRLRSIAVKRIEVAQQQARSRSQRRASD